MKELIKIQSELVAPKDQFNKFGGYKYRSTEGILSALKPLLAKYDCFINIHDEIVERGGRVYVCAFATIKNANGEIVTSTAYAREEETKKGMDAAQITGAASSYARKYALNGLFAIDDTKDADATNEHDKSGETAEEEKPWFSDENMKATIEATSGGNFAAWGGKEKMLDSIYAKYKVNKKHREQLLNL